MKLDKVVLSGFCALAATSAVAATGRYVHIRLETNPAILSLSEVEVLAGGQNVAKGKPTAQSSTGWGGDARRAVDGNAHHGWESGTITHTNEDDKGNPQWWEVDLRQNVSIDRIRVHNREGYEQRFNGAHVLVLDEKRTVVWGKSFPDGRKLVFDLDLATDPGAEFKGEEIDDLTHPASPEEILAAYEKKGTWLESALGTATKLTKPYRSLSPLADKLISDFPEAAEEILANIGSHALSKANLRKGPPKLQPPLSICDEVQLRREALKWFNPEALDRAIRAYAQKHPEVYGSGEDLLAQLAAAQKLVKEADNEAKREAAAEAVMKLTDAIYLRNPGVDFSRILVVKRARNGHSGLPQNWQGNSSVPLHGYANSIVSAPLARRANEREKLIVTSSSFLGDVDLDFDADRIAYSGGVNGEPGWRIMETPLDKPLTRVQKSPDYKDIDCYDPCYLPDGRMLFVATSGFHGVPCVGGSDYVGNTHLLEKDGTVKRLVYDQDNSWCPVVMNNGRVLYLRWEYTDSAHYFSRVMMTMNPDGSDQKAFYGSNSYWPNSLFYARPLPGSVTKFCGIVSGHHGLAREGELVLFDVMKGRHETAGVIQRIPGYGQPVRNKTRDTLVNDSHPLFLHPYPVTDELFLVSVHRHGGEPFIVAFADIYDNIVPILAAEKFNLLEPLPIVKRKRPIMSIDRRNDKVDTCTVYLQRVQFGGGLKGLPAGTAKKLRLFHYSYSPRNVGGHYNIGFEGPWDARNVLGDVDLEADGSCMFTAPANTPIAIQPLDAQGRKLQEMRSWFVGVPGETISCTGCHENQNEAPPMQSSIAARKKPQTIQPWYGPRRNYAFERELQPVLDRKCVGCHKADTTLKTRLGGKLPDFTGGRRHHYSTGYLNLMPYVRRNGPEGDYHLLTPLEFHVSTSELYQRLVKGHHGVELTPEELDRFVVWMDLNVPYWGTWTEENGGDHAKRMLARRKEMAEKWSGDTYDAEAIVNPYKPGTEAFVPPTAKKAAPAPAPAVANWPFSAETARALQGGRAPQKLDLGGGESLTLAYIPAGSFAMGANNLTPAEQPVHAATVKKGFWMATTEITQGQMRLMDPAFDNGVYDKHYKDQVKRGYYMGDEDPDFVQPGHTNFPAIRVSWDMARKYCDWLSKKTGKKVRLPTETEWEWACRAGSADDLNYGTIDDDFSKRENLADYMFIELAVTGVDPQPIARGDDPNPRNRPDPVWDFELRERRYNDHVLHLAPVGTYAPNAWGLHDMHGNVAEWTSTPWAKYAGNGEKTAESAEKDLKVVRGGSWYRRPCVSGSAWRWRYPSWMRPFDVGFRIVVED